MIASGDRKQVLLIRTGRTGRRGKPGRGGSAFAGVDEFRAACGEAGPGTVGVMLTLSAHASMTGLLPDGLAHIGILIAIVVLSFLVFLSYAYAPKITSWMSPQTAHGILRIVAFVLLCIGVQITWNGVQAMLKTVVRS